MKDDAYVPSTSPGGVTGAKTASFVSICR